MSLVAAPPLDPDAKRLAELGYRQDLVRRLRFFDNAAMGFATISAVVGLDGHPDELQRYGHPRRA